jgi:putative effector of murein hydrolase LrgA (UPF0299 family)
MDTVRALLTFDWLAGYRTTIIAIALVVGYIVEKVIGIDIPGADFNLEIVLVALGLKAAAVHDTKQ